jgi:hypothetical protein
VISSLPPHIILACDSSIEDILGYSTKQFIGEVDGLKLMFRGKLDSYRFVANYLKEDSSHYGAIQTQLTASDGASRSMTISCNKDQDFPGARCISIRISEATSLSDALLSGANPLAIVSAKPPYHVCTANAQYVQSFTLAGIETCGNPLTNLCSSGSCLERWRTMIEAAAHGQVAEAPVRARTSFCLDYACLLRCTPVASGSDVPIVFVAALFQPFHPSTAPAPAYPPTTCRLPPMEVSGNMTSGQAALGDLRGTGSLALHRPHALRPSILVAQTSNMLPAPAPALIAPRSTVPVPEPSSTTRTVHDQQPSAVSAVSSASTASTARRLPAHLSPASDVSPVHPAEAVAPPPSAAVTAPTDTGGRRPGRGLKGGRGRRRGSPAPAAAAAAAVAPSATAVAAIVAVAAAVYPPAQSDESAPSSPTFPPAGGGVGGSGDGGVGGGGGGVSGGGGDGGSPALLTAPCKLLAQGDGGGGEGRLGSRGGVAARAAGAGGFRVDAAATRSLLGRRRQDGGPGAVLVVDDAYLRRVLRRCRTAERRCRAASGGGGGGGGGSDGGVGGGDRSRRGPESP